MSDSTTSLVIGLLLIAGVSGLVWYQNADRSSQGTEAGTSAQANTDALYSMAEVEARGSTGSCWTVIDGGVYDLTEWISQHPGGAAAIESLCGTDGTAAFRAQHSHAARQEGILAAFKIGALAQ
jgi:cytochrome b involved in lipid metabolism